MLNSVQIFNPKFSQLHHLSFDNTTDRFWNINPSRLETKQIGFYLLVFVMNKSNSNVLRKALRLNNINRFVRVYFRFQSSICSKFPEGFRVQCKSNLRIPNCNLVFVPRRRRSLLLCVCVFCVIQSNFHESYFVMYCNWVFINFYKLNGKGISPC